MSPMPDIVPISQLRADAAAMVQRTTLAHEPIFITQRGRASAVLMSASDYERKEREMEILRMLARGEAEIEAGEGRSLPEVMAKADRIIAGLSGP